MKQSSNSNYLELNKTKIPNKQCLTIKTNQLNLILNQSNTLDSKLSWDNLINCDHLQGFSSQGNTMSHHDSRPKEEPQTSRHPKGQTPECPGPPGHLSGVSIGVDDTIKTEEQPSLSESRIQPRVSLSAAVSNQREHTS